MKILIVDDQADIRDLLHFTLDLAQSFEIHEAVNAPDAVSKAEQLRPDLVLMDIMMPGAYDGLEGCRRIKQLTPAPKVILVSAKPISEVRQAAADAGADLFMNKPFGPAQLVEKLMSVYQSKVAAESRAS